MKRLIISCDGTGKSGGVGKSSNVWLLHNLISPADDEGIEQVKYYDAGIGSSGVNSWKTFAGLFGWGLNANLREALLFLAQHYQDGDEIYLFGYSRGAYTVRALASIIKASGILPRSIFATKSASDRDGLAKACVKNYRRLPGSVKRLSSPALREHLMWPEECGHTVDKVKFIGVFDTVDSVGMPFRSIRKLIAWPYEKLTGKRLWSFHDRYATTADVCRQALALDEQRTAFTPNVWEENDDENQADILQVWFAGVHGNVGGGLGKDEVAKVPLTWLAKQAQRQGLALNHAELAKYERQADPMGALADSREGLLGRIQSYSRRDVSASSRLHESVVQRAASGYGLYAPKVLIDHFMDEEGLVRIWSKYDNELKSILLAKRSDSYYADWAASEAAATTRNLARLTSFWLTVVYVAIYLFHDKGSPDLPYLVALLVPGMFHEFVNELLHHPLEVGSMVAVGLGWIWFSRHIRSSENELFYALWARVRLDDLSDEYKPKLKRLGRYFKFVQSLMFGVTLTASAAVIFITGLTIYYSLMN